MFYSRFKPTITIYIISIDKVFSNQLLLKLEDDTDCMVFQDSSVEEFFEEIESNPITKETIPIVLVDFELKTMEDQNAKDGVEVMKEIKAKFPNWEVIIMSDLSSIQIKNDINPLGQLFHIYKNNNTGERIINRIHQIQNRYYLRFKRKSVLVSMFVFVILLAVLYVSRSIFYFFD